MTAAQAIARQRVGRPFVDPVRHDLPGVEEQPDRPQHHQKDQRNLRFHIELVGDVVGEEARHQGEAETADEERPDIPEPITTVFIERPPCETPTLRAVSSHPS